ncbi:hypothetical protein [Halorussus halophilus]|uniref:hypothetical protein n=1 Tax=Halorussus halophilus TaxID=2650975 RepID=UPI001CE454B5|nr:hypothetical protein [Halorussus halophilus]
MTDSRERRMDNLLEATGENTKSKALDRAAEFYLKMRGNNVAVPTGAFVELMERAEKQGSVTAPEIAEILNTDQLPVQAEISWDVGNR